jgi:hypothetical protein
MPAELLEVRGVVLTGWEAHAVATLAERYVNTAQCPDPRVRELLDVLRRYAAGCAPQPAQPSADDEAPSFPADDEMTVKEVAELMRCTQSNVRKRAGKSLPGLKIGNRWVLSRDGVVAAIAGRYGR